MRLIAALLLAFSAVAGVACSTPTGPPRVVTGGDADRGLEAIERHGCAACHDIPGVRRARPSRVAPPLHDFAERSYIAGVLVNNEENLIRWIMDPTDVDPQTAMPDLDVSEVEARDIVAHLYSG